jgi:hypothetical protein
MNILQDYESSDSEKEEVKIDFFSLGSLKRPAVEQEVYLSKRITPTAHFERIEEKNPYLVTEEYAADVQKLDIQELQKLGHKMNQGPIEIIDIDQGSRLREFQNQKHSADHILPAKDSRKRHTIFSLASKAEEEQGMMEIKRSKMDETRKLSKKKYGF